ncbi:hypothetical protein B0H14DRAFT_2978102 [Mycena olivaceomarginata]|nr:hypothetical protein B0H14DRAFT_2978102 [Mycena olivaceomarginata]
MSQQGGNKSCMTNNHYTIYGGVGGPGGPGQLQGQGGSGGTGEGNTLHQHFDTVQNVTTVNIGKGGENAEEERAKLINWVSPINFYQRQSDILGVRQPNTGGWILEDVRFKNWEAFDGTILWCEGIPGAGKTILASIVVDYLESKNGGGKSAVACLYLTHKELQTQTLENLLAGLWRQLVPETPSAWYSVQQLYKDHLKRGTRPLLVKIYELLCSAVAQWSKVYLVVDALDEYPDDPRMILLRYLTTIGPQVNLMLTSRPSVTAGKGLCREFTTLTIRGSDTDIQIYLAERIRLSSNLQDHINEFPDLEGQIVEEIRRAADGIFLLAKLHIESLAQYNDLDSFEKALGNLPRNLPDAYKDTMDRIIHCDKEKDKELALAALTWVAKAKRPLTVAEIRDALAIDSNSKTLNPRRRPYLTSILRVCAGLLIVEENTSIVRLVHFTTQAYLDIYLTQGHTDITRLLLAYLAFDNLETPHEALDSSGTRGSYDLEQAPLIAYTGYFLDHAELAKRNMETDVHSLRDIIITFLERPP